jgi:hypothetical protein
MAEFEWMGVSFAILMGVFFVVGMLANNYFVVFFSLICAICSGILIDGYPSKVRGEIFG